MHNLSSGLILLDTNILSTFAKIDYMTLLFETVRNKELGISTSVLHELEDARNIGLVFVDKIFQLINNNKILIFSMSDKETMWSMKLPSSFGKGERDSLAICKFRKGILFTNERKIINFCERESIDVLDLPSFLRYLWKSGMQSKKEVRKIIEIIEDKDNIKFVDITNIFQE